MKGVLKRLLMAVRRTDPVAMDVQQAALVDGLPGEPLLPQFRV
jgi:hypothetical protein